LVESGVGCDGLKELLAEVVCFALTLAFVASALCFVIGPVSDLTLASAVRSRLALAAHLEGGLSKQ
jgi:hypothetical protein